MARLGRCAARPAGLNVPIPAITLVFLLAAGCTSIHLSETSRQGAAAGSLFIRILVAATAEDANMGRALESEVVARLADTGTRGFAAHQSLPTGSAADRAALTALADRLGADAMLDVRLTLDTRTEPPSVKVTVVPAVTFWGSPRAAGRAPYASYTRTVAARSTRPAWRRTSARSTTRHPSGPPPPRRSRGLICRGLPATLRTSWCVSCGASA
jgi:hypothetical protein